MKTKEEGLLLNRSTRFSTFTLRYRSDTKKCHQEISRASLTRTIDRSRLLIFSGSLTIIHSSWIPAISTSRLKAIFLFFKAILLLFFFGHTSLMATYSEFPEEAESADLEEWHHIRSCTLLWVIIFKWNFISFFTAIIFYQTATGVHDLLYAQ